MHRYKTQKTRWTIGNGICLNKCQTNATHNAAPNNTHTTSPNVRMNNEDNAFFVVADVFHFGVVCRFYFCSKSPDESLKITTKQSYFVGFN